MTGGVLAGGVSAGGVPTGGVLPGGVSAGGVLTGGVLPGGVSAGGVAFVGTVQQDDVGDALALNGREDIALLRVEEHPVGELALGQSILVSRLGHCEHVLGARRRCSKLESLVPAIDLPGTWRR